MRQKQISRWTKTQNSFFGWFWIEIYDWWWWEKNDKAHVTCFIPTVRMHSTSSPTYVVVGTRSIADLKMEEFSSQRSQSSLVYTTEFLNVFLVGVRSQDWFGFTIFFEFWWWGEKEGLYVVIIFEIALLFFFSSPIFYFNNNSKKSW